MTLYRCPNHPDYVTDDLLDFCPDCMEYLPLCPDCLMVDPPVTLAYKSLITRSGTKVKVRGKVLVRVHKGCLHPRRSPIEWDYLPIPGCNLIPIEDDINWDQEGVIEPQEPEVIISGEGMEQR